MLPIILWAGNATRSCVRSCWVCATVITDIDKRPAKTTAARCVLAGGICELLELVARCFAGARYSTAHGLSSSPHSPVAALSLFAALPETPRRPRFRSAVQRVVTHGAD